MTKPIKNLVATVGSYTNKDGESKNKYLNVGTLMRTADGNEFILLNRTFNPAGVPVDDAGKESILISMFDIQKKDGAGATTGSASAKTTDGEIPF